MRYNELERSYNSLNKEYSSLSLRYASLELRYNELVGQCVQLNDTLIKGSVGKYGYTVQSIVGAAESRHGLTAFTSNSFYVIFDKLSTTLSAPGSCIDVGSAMK